MCSCVCVHVILAPDSGEVVLRVSVRMAHKENNRGGRRNVENGEREIMGTVIKNCYQHDNVVLSILVFLLFHSFSLSVLTIGFNRIVYRVKESVGTVKVCASVKWSVELERAVVVQYGTVDQLAVGMMRVCMFVFVCVRACMCQLSRNPE